ncbi:MAG: RlmI/RlmK family 23S rRNA methyltransferase, partial [Maritimibacter harenae]
MTDTRPVIRLKPKANARAIRHGAPWVFDNEIVTDRRSRAIAPGTVARLEDGDRNPLGTVAVNPTSRIFARMLDRDPEAEIDHAWLSAKLRTALDHRARVYDAPFYRLVHAEADGLPGVVIDRFGDVAAIQPNAAWADVLFDTLARAVVEVTGVTTVVKNASGRSRALEGLEEGVEVTQGALDGPVPVPMNGAT